MHATCAVADAHRGASKLPGDVIALPDKSSPAIRRLLNNLGGAAGCRFLAIGAGQGAAAVAAGYGNSGVFVTIDGFGQFGGQDACEAVLARYRDVAAVELIVGNALDIPAEVLAPVDVLFYAGAHNPAALRHVIEHLGPALAEACIVVVDAWNWPVVRAGLRGARPARPWYPLAQWELFTAHIEDDDWACEDADSWWNGLYIGVYAMPAGGVADPDR